MNITHQVINKLVYKLKKMVVRNETDHITRSRNYIESINSVSEQCENSVKISHNLQNQP